jgi:hypothetical protein
MKASHPATGDARLGRGAAMTCRIFRLGSREPMNELELHVLAKAYYAAWQCVHGGAPAREHILSRLGLLIDFGPPAPPVQGTPPARG